MKRRVLSALLLLLSLFPSVLSTNMDSASAQLKLEASLNSMFGFNETNNTISNLSNGLQPAEPIITTSEVNKTCNVPIKKPVMNVPVMNVSTAGLVTTKSIEPNEIIAYGLNAQNSTLAENTTVTISIKGFGGVSEKKSAVDVVFSIDGSGSMEQNDPNNLRIQAAKTFIDSLDPQQDSTGFISWSSKLDLVDGLTSDFESLKSKLDTIERKAGTNLNIGITGAIEMLDKSSTNVEINSTKSIVLLTDGKGEYTESGMPGSPADEAGAKGYKIFPIGLNVEGTEAEIDLKDIASATGGQYFSAPTAENLDLVFNQIFQKVVSITAPSNISILEATPSYIVVHENSSTIPLSNTFQDEDKTTLQWDDVARFVGNQDSNLDQNETFTVQFKASSSRQGESVPVELDPNAHVSFVDSSGQNMTVPIPQAYLNVRAPGVSSEGVSSEVSNVSQAEGLRVQTDKDRYSDGEDVNIKGNVGKLIKEVQYVNLSLYNKNGNLAHEFEPIPVGLDGSFQASTTINILSFFLIGGADISGDAYAFAKYGNSVACEKFFVSDKHTTVGSNPGSGITIHLDKQVYRTGESVTLTGNVGRQINFSDLNADVQVRMDTFDQQLNFPSTEYLPLKEDGTFSTTFQTTAVGKHTILITYDRKSSETLYVTR